MKSFFLYYYKKYFNKIKNIFFKKKKNNTLTDLTNDIEYTPIEYITNNIEYKHVENIENKNEVCCICFEDISLRKKIILSDCCHEIHVSCAKKWFLEKSECPLCRKSQSKLKNRLFK